MSNFLQETNLAITKFNINKAGDLVDLEINGKNIELGSEVVTTLYAWKNSSNYIYTKKIPTAAGTIAAIAQNPMASISATYVEATPAVSHDIWKIGSTFYKSDLTTGTEPAGTAGTPVDLGDVYIATSSDTDLEEGVWYTKDTDWYKVSALTKTALTKGDKITDEDAITALEAATTSEVDYVPYTEAAVDAHLSYDNKSWARQSDKDYTL